MYVLFFLVCWDFVCVCTVIVFLCIITLYGIVLDRDDHCSYIILCNDNVSPLSLFEIHPPLDVLRGLRNKWG